MTDLELRDRISKAKEKVAKLERAIAKYGKYASPEFLDACKRHDRDYYRAHKFDQYEDNDEFYDGAGDLWRRCDELNTVNNTIAKYERQLINNQEKAAQLAELPECFNTFREQLVTSWDEFDKNRRDEMCQALHELDSLPYAEWREKKRALVSKYGVNLRDKAYEDDEHIHKENVKAAEQVVLDLVNRVTYKTGKITDFSGLHLDYDNRGFCCINGIVTGEGGTAKVESILAGGYNIQRLHVRVLVH